MQLRGHAIELRSLGRDAILGDHRCTIDGGKELWGDYWAIPDPPDMPPIEIPVEPWERGD